jgi:hypothetical protein
MTTYTIRQLKVEDLNDTDLCLFLANTADEMNDRYGNKFDVHNFDIENYIRYHRFMVCFKNEKPVGVMMSRLSYTVFDPKVIVLRQDHLSAVKGTRAAYLLMKDFIDFGKSNANHIITAIADKTNIKHQSLKKLGFKELEILYRMEVQK